MLPALAGRGEEECLRGKMKQGRELSEPGKPAEPGCGLCH